MLPFEAPTIFEQLPRFIFKMPRVVQDQKSKFESDELFRRLSRESEVRLRSLRRCTNTVSVTEVPLKTVRYTGFRDRPVDERQIRFQNSCREGHTETVSNFTSLCFFNNVTFLFALCDSKLFLSRNIYTLHAFITTGTNLQLVFNPCVNGYNEGCDFDKEHGKVHIRSSFIMNGVCVRWRGWIDLERLDGVGCLEYDEERGAIEETILREQMERYNSRMREFEERQRIYKAAQERQSEPEVRNASRTREAKWSMCLLCFNVLTVS
ncbi:protein big brother-like protein [Leptotrombidium deliense]|uniref:Protein big brother-like protein n=1 Tax=Leptotrombidium deliense TaxID=299467 RepID=A0A443SR82_9ACAR|nr:protein big brother-like protein [Leptotrombidium deliense]